VPQISSKSAPWRLAIVDDFDFISQNLPNIEAQQGLLVPNWDLASLRCTSFVPPCLVDLVLERLLCVGRQVALHGTPLALKLA